jgi:hypothetical protein
MRPIAYVTDHVNGLCPFSQEGRRVETGFSIALEIESHCEI